MIKMSAPCPRYDQLYNEFLSESDVMKNINASEATLFEYLSNYSGKSIRDPQQVEYLFDDLFIEVC